ncbi:hypothetical protein BGX34_006701 [Mortierella sp. NVP85]|nr:hypothetical protein BGX34_006701 [Mortierella sp. NVP85]
MGKKSANTVNQKQNCACGRHAMGEKEGCRFCREEYCCGPVCERCNGDREHLMTCDSCAAPVCDKCQIITKGNREGNTCKNCKDRVGVAAEATVGA